MNAPLIRAVPDARFRVASSDIATVSVRPGRRTMRPPSVAIEHAERAERPGRARAPRRSRGRRPPARTRGRAAGVPAPGQARGGPSPSPRIAATAISRPPAAEELGGRPGDDAVGQRRDPGAVRRRRRGDPGDRSDAVPRRHPALRHVERHLLQCRERAEIDLAGRHPEHVGALPADRAEGGHDRGRGREELGIDEAQPVGDRRRGCLPAAGRSGRRSGARGRARARSRRRRDRARRGGARLCYRRGRTRRLRLGAPKLGTDMRRRESGTSLLLTIKR